MSQPDFDGVYRTRPAERIFGRKKHPDNTPKISPQHSPNSSPKKSIPETPKGASPQPSPHGGYIYPPVEVGGDLGGNPTPVTPTWESWGEVGGKPKKPRAQKTKKPDLVIIEDTREQTPLTDWPDGVKIENHGLDTGDYSIKGWENCFTIERKSLADFAGTMLNGYQGNTQKPRLRFNNELERMRHFDLAAVIVTATPFELMTFKHHCGMDAHEALWNFGLSVYATYRIPVFYLGDEQTAAKWIADLARHFVAMRTKKNRSREDRAKQIADEWAF